MVPVTLWATARPELTHPQVFRLWVGTGFFYAVVNWANTEARLRLLLLGVAGGALGLAVFATVSVEWAVDKLFFIPARNNFVSHTLYEVIRRLFFFS